MKLELLHDLCESRLFGGSKYNIHKYNARDIAEILFLHICAIQILKHEFYGLPEVQEYMKNSGNLINFDYWSAARNELYALLHILIGRFGEPQRKMLSDQDASQALLKRIAINMQYFRRYLRLVQSGQSDLTFERRFLLDLEHGLKIDNSHYRSIRRLVQGWPTESESVKKLVMTRLLQFLRAKSRRSELLVILEKISKKERIEDKNLKPFSDEGSIKSQITPAKPKMSFLKGLAAFGAGIATSQIFGNKQKSA